MRAYLSLVNPFALIAASALVGATVGGSAVAVAAERDQAPRHSVVREHGPRHDLGKPVKDRRHSAKDATTGQKKTGQDRPRQRADRPGRTAPEKRPAVTPQTAPSTD
jgi:hypothetical protein